MVCEETHVHPSIESTGECEENDRLGGCLGKRQPDQGGSCAPVSCGDEGSCYLRKHKICCKMDAMGIT